MDGSAGQSEIIESAVTIRAARRVGASGPTCHVGLCQPHRARTRPSNCRGGARPSHWTAAVVCAHSAVLAAGGFESEPVRARVGPADPTGLIGSRITDYLSCRAYFPCRPGFIMRTVPKFGSSGCPPPHRAVSVETASAGRQSVSAVTWHPMGVQSKPSLRVMVRMSIVGGRTTSSCADADSTFNFTFRHDEEFFLR